MGEKFESWSDDSTGIHPFLPPEPKLLYGESKPSIVSQILGVPIALIRIPFLLISLSSLFLLDYLFGLIPVIGNLLNRVNHILLGGLSLFLLGFYNNKITYCTSKKGNRPPKGLSPGDEIKKGHLIICNHTSYVDILLLTRWFSPQFTTIPSKGNGILPVSLFNAFKNAITNDYPTGDGMPIDDFIKRYGKSKPIVVFPEGTTTNGRVLIGNQPIFGNRIGLDQNSIHVLGLNYEWTSVSPSYTVERFVLHVFKLCSQISNNAKATLILSADIPKEPIDFPNTWSDDLLNILAKNALKIERGKILRDQKITFLQKYSKRHYKKTE